MASLPPSQRPSPPSSQRSTSQASSPTQSTHASLPAPLTMSTAETVVIEPVSKPRISPRQSESPSSKSKTAEDDKKCWICFSDASEDTPATSRWRSPCPCSLTAHEACLLDWVADIEASNSGKTKKIQCPQCKAEIQIVRPYSVLVDAVNSFEYAASRLVAPVLLVIGSSTIVYMSLSYGVIAIRTVLGQDDFARIFQSPLTSYPQLVRRISGVTIIPWMLIFSRTHIADSVLPVVPMFYFVTQPRADPITDMAAWPPSAGLSFALLPYVRAGYNALYDYAFGRLERRWTNEIKPRSQSRANNPGDNAVALEIEVGLEEGEDDSDNEDNDDGVPLAEAGGAIPVAQVLGEEGQERPAGPVPPGVQVPQRRRDYSISISKITKSMLGALSFPAIAAVMGEMLRLQLPSSWTSLPAGKLPSKFFQTRWGRCIVGGCMFVVLKDAVMLYVKWKMAQNHRLRSVANWKGKK